jgi:hypothetical protein
MGFSWLSNILNVDWNGSSGLMDSPVLNKQLTIYEVIKGTSCVQTLSCVTWYLRLSRSFNFNNIWYWNE